MIYLKINDAMYPASFRQRIMDTEWNNRGSMAITLNMSHQEASEIFVDDLQWQHVQQFPPYEDENKEIVTPEPIVTDYFEYSVAGPITDNRDGTVTVKMGKITAEEALAELMEVLA